MDKANTISSTKEKEKMEKRRNQLVKGAVSLFKEKGFHRTTNGDIAEASGVSTGTLYEYIHAKEEILFLVCDSIYDRVEERVSPITLEKSSAPENLETAIRAYFEIMDEMQDEVVVMYQEMKSLPKDARNYVLKKERKMTDMFEAIIKTNTEKALPETEVLLIANNIFVQGQMWAFRRWMLQKDFSLETYTDLQIKHLLNGLRAAADQ